MALPGQSCLTAGYQAVARAIFRLTVLDRYEPTVGHQVSLWEPSLLAAEVLRLPAELA